MIEDSSKHTCNKNKHALCVRSFSFELEGIYAFFTKQLQIHATTCLNGNFLKSCVANFVLKPNSDLVVPNLGKQKCLITIMVH